MARRRASSLSMYWPKLVLIQAAGEVQRPLVRPPRSTPCGPSRPVAQQAVLPIKQAPPVR